MFPGTTETPRPRPPAKVRRAAGGTSSVKVSTPPPAYASALTYSEHSRQACTSNTLLGSPMTATFQMVGWEVGGATSNQDEIPPISEEDLEWMNEKSREELAELLLKAGDLIKNRENELGITSAVCKTLYENNIALKSKHQALLARLPTPPSQSASSPTLSSTPLSQSPTELDSCLSRSSSESVIGASIISGHHRTRSRKISVCTADISLLADQNAELMDKIEKLESEASAADQTGRRELKRLEKEIMVLRDSLEKIQEKNDELEERAQWGTEKMVEEVWKKKQARDEKFKAMRNLGRNFQSEGSALPSFAPEGSLFGGPTSTFSFFPKRKVLRQQSRESLSPNDLPDRSSGQPLMSPKVEHSIVSQLLLKIQELENANKRIIDQQIETSNQLHAVQRETNHINKIYESLADQNHLELEIGKRALQSSGSSEFGRLRQDLPDDLSSSYSSSDRTANQRDFQSRRQSVLGIFDESVSDQPTLESSSKPFSNFPTPYSYSPWNQSRDQSSWSRGTGGMLSPALSSISFSPPGQPFSDLFPSEQPTLESELASQLDENWGLNSDNHLLRNTSLFDITQFSVPPSPSPLSQVSRTHTASLEDAPEGSLKTPMSLKKSNLRLSVEPPTPENIPQAERQTLVPMPSMSPMSPRLSRMSQTIRSRASVWDLKRFNDSSAMEREYLDRCKTIEQCPSIPSNIISVPRRVASAVEQMVENFAHRDSQMAHSNSDPQSPIIQESKSVQLRSNGNTVNQGRSGMGTILLTVWMWFQFAVIIFFFVWAMARKGPKSVIIEIDRNAVGKTRR